MDSPQIIFELQWKKKPGIAQIGIVLETTDEFLDFQTFKSYLGQNLGTLDDINVSYIDNDGDEIPIDSECEFKEALKFSRYQANLKRNVILRIEKKSSSPLLNKHLSSEKLNDFKEQMCSKTEKLLKVKGSQESQSRWNSGKLKPSTLKLQCSKTLNEDRRGSLKSKDRDDKIPYWFKKYMDQMKEEIIQEVTQNVMKNTKKMFEEINLQSKNTNTTCPRKKTQEHENTEKDHKHLKKMERLHKREKKLEKKLDLKLEKLENKAKKLIEKKNCPKHVFYSRVRPIKMENKKMNILVLNFPTSPIHINLMDRYCQIFNIINTGTLAWNDDMELRIMSKSDDLEIATQPIQCPPLIPNQRGEICINFLIPAYPGRFDSIWSFYTYSEDHFLGPPLEISLIVSNGEENKKFINSSINASINYSEIKEPHYVEPNCVHFSLNSPTVSQIDKKNKNTEELIDKISSVNDSTTKLKKFCLDSESEDDNISILSGSLTISDSENENNFVFIPMPPCFSSELPSTSASTNLKNNVTVKIPSEKRIRELIDIIVWNIIEHRPKNSTTIHAFKKWKDFQTLKFQKEETIRGIIDILAIHPDTAKLFEESDEPENSTTNDDTASNNLKNYLTLKAKKDKRIRELIDFFAPHENSTTNDDTASNNLENNLTRKTQNEKNIREVIDLISIKAHRNKLFEEESDESDNSTTNDDTAYNKWKKKQLKGNPCLNDKKRREFIQCFISMIYNSNKVCEECYPEINGMEDCYPQLHRMLRFKLEETPRANQFEGSNEPENFTTNDEELHFNNENFSDNINDYSLEFEKYKDPDVNIFAVDSQGLCYPIEYEEPELNFNYPYKEQTNDHSNKANTNENETKFSNEDSKSRSSSSPTFNQEHASTSRQDFHSNMSTHVPFPTDSVSILPGTLIDGAISVASNAYSTAKSVFNTLRRPGEYESKKPSHQVQKSLDILNEMGFLNNSLNTIILERFNNDLNKAISELLLIKTMTRQPLK